MKATQNGRRVIGGMAAAVTMMLLGMTSPAEAGPRVVIRTGPCVKKTVVVKKAPVVKRTVVVKPAKTVVVKPAVKTTVVVRPGWWKDAPRMTYRSGSYYLNTSFGVYFGGAALNLTLTDGAPAGYVYYHPYSGKRFPTVAAFKTYCARHPRQPRVLTVIAI